MDKEKSPARDGACETLRYEPIANDVCAVLAKYKIAFWEVPTLLELVKLKCQYQNHGKPLAP